MLITGLAAGAGPGVELLDYLAPQGGRPYPVTSHVTDLWHWHTILLVSDLDNAYRIVQQKKYMLISPGIVPITYPGLAAKRGLLVRDPDGHAVLLCE